MQTGISGNTLRYILHPLMTFVFLFSTSSAVVSCFALNLAPFPLILIPHSPNAKVVPLIEPPIGIGIRPLWRFMCWTWRGASWERGLEKTVDPFKFKVGAMRRELERKDRSMCSSQIGAKLTTIRFVLAVRPGLLPLRMPPSRSERGDHRSMQRYGWHNYAWQEYMTGSMAFLIYCS